jgi:predicted MFS family arabinose efflux permease
VVLQIERVTFREVLKVREFSVLWIAEAQSLAGDQLARVALSILVFEQTSSAILTALTYALTFLPALIGGALLTGLADKYRRRELMVLCDVIRALIFAATSIPSLPLTVTGALLVVATLAGSPFTAAENALMPSILHGEQYVVGTGLRSLTTQLSQLAGFAGGGLVIAYITPRGGLAIDAMTFALSALLLMLGLADRDPASDPAEVSNVSEYLSSVASGARYIFGDPRLRTLLGLGWLTAFYVVPEGVAAPFAADLGGGARATGLLMAALPAGTAFGTLCYVKLVPAATRSRAIGVLAVLSAAPLAVCPVTHSLAAALALWFASGFFGGYLVQVYADYARSVPDGRRGQAIGLASSGSLAAQGAGVLSGGVVAAIVSPAAAVGVAGIIGAILALFLAVAWSRVAAYRGTHSQTPDREARTSTL